MTTFQAGLEVCLDVEFRETPGGPFVDPPDARFDVIDPNGVVVVANEVTTIVVAPGRHHGCYQSTINGPLGTWTMRFKATIDDAPVAKDCTFDLDSEIAPTRTCALWPFEEDCCSLPEGDHTALIQKMRAVATDRLWAAGGRVHGTCPVTVRPCLRRCAESFGVFTGWPFVPYIDHSGAWRNLSTCACGDVCSCTELCEIVLEGPVASVTSVKIDGVLVPPDAYRLDYVGAQARLLRTDGGCLPACQDVNANCNEIGSFCVTYEKGLPLTQSAIAAFSELVCELVKACIPGCKCRIPANVARKVRSDVTLEFDVTQPWIRRLPHVDAWLTEVNPSGLQRPLRVLSPDARGPRRGG